MSIKGNSIVCDQCETTEHWEHVRGAADIRKQAKARGWEVNIEPSPEHEALYSLKRDECPDCKPDGM